MKNILLLTLAFLLHTSFAHAQIITTIAGDSTAGYNGDGIAATAAELNQPIGVAVDGAGNVYIGDRYNHRIRKVDASGNITTIAGTGVAGFSGDSGLATAAKIYNPYGVAVDNAGNVYFVDDINFRVRKIDNAGIITTIAGNGTSGYNGDSIPAVTAQMSPGCVAVDGSGNVYISDFYHQRIRKIDNAGIITTIAGTGVADHTGDNGPATAATMFDPYGIALDATGNIYISEYGSSIIRKVNTAGIITTLAGTVGSIGSTGDNGPAVDALLNHPIGIAVDAMGNIFFSDDINNRVRMINTAGIITTVAGGGASNPGDGGPAINARLVNPACVAVDGWGDLYIADFGHSRIRYMKSPVGINAVNTTDIKCSIYPNPSAGEFTINISSPVDEKMQIVIANAIGQTVKSELIRTNHPASIFLHQPPGIYYLSAVSNHSVWNTTIIISA